MGKRKPISHLDALIQASKLLNSTLDLEQLLEIILDIGVRHTLATTGTIYLHIARTIQQHLLPGRLPPIPGYDLAAVNLPCEAVGGDYHDVFHQQDKLCLAIADVSGKGFPLPC